MSKIISSTVAVLLAGTVASANIVSDTAGKTMDAAGLFVNTGSGAYDWIYTAPDGSYAFKLEGMNPDTNQFIWAPITDKYESISVAGTKVTFGKEVANTTCPEGTTAGEAINGHNVCKLPNEVTSDLHLSAGSYYEMEGETTVKNGATLTVDAGTVVYGVSGETFLAIDRGSKLEAVGRSDAPVIFTSYQDVKNDLNEDVYEAGQWGGLSIFGYARTTRSANSGEELYEAGDHAFGCSDAAGNCNDADNSGTLKYVIVKHTGYEVEKDKELNGLSLGGVGSSTVIENVGVLSSLDDGIELWGGTVDMRNIYILNANDDSLDFDHGWTGSVNNIYIEQKYVDGTGSRAVESDTDGGHEDYTPASNPVVKNFTMITVAEGGQGIVSREAAAGRYSNGIVITHNEGKANIEVRSAATLTNGLTYSNVTLAQAAGVHYAGHDEDAADKIIGNTTDAEVQALVEKGYVNKTTKTDLAEVKATDKTITGANESAFGWLTSTFTK